MLNTKALAASVSAPPAVYVEDVFSTYLYTGNGSTQTITNGIDLAGEGGLVWIKDRTNENYHFLYDTARGAQQSIYSNDSSGQVNSTTGLTSFTSSGFTLGSNVGVNYSGANLASWTFRKAAKFFDVVTYTGTGSARTVAHNLGSVPGCIIIKRTDTTGDWQVYHRANTAAPETDYLVLNSTAATADSDTRWNDTLPTSTVFSLGTEATVNASGGTYVAYLFAHDAGGFGDAGTDSVVSCGSYTGNGSSTGPVIDLGWEPQWLMLKWRDGGGNWIMVDNMRGAATGGDDQVLLANTTNAEGAVTAVDFTATGFQITNDFAQYNTDGDTYIYIAIRRGPMKTPTVGTEVFSANIGSTGNNTPGFVTDNLWNFYRPGSSSNTGIRSRLQGNTPYLVTSSAAAEATGSDYKWDTNNGVNYTWGGGTDSSSYYFRRAPGFFDVVAYTGTGVDLTVSHNLGVAPELMIVKRRDTADEWYVYSSSLATPSQNWLRLASNAAANGPVGQDMWGPPTSTTFKVDTYLALSTSSATYIAYLFATCPGVSKVGSYTGTGTTLDIDCGFTAGSRLVLIKRTDSTGSWYIWDTARGIVSGDDSYLLLNSTAAEVTNTDYIDPLSSGFQISSTAPAEINASGGSFIFLAVA